MPPRLILCRHGSTKFNGKGIASADRIRGWIDVPLDREGEEQAVELTNRLKGEEIAEIHSSPLVRAEETAERIADAHWLKVRPDRGLMPWNVGELAGQPTEEVLPKMVAMEKNGKAPKGGEPFDEFRKRYLRTLVKLLERAKRAGTICAVTHTRNFQVTKAWLAADRPEDLSVDDAVMNDYSKEVGTGGILEVRP